MEGKFYYTIGEVAEIMQTSTSQLRYWSGEFHLNVRKNRKGDRLFQKDDLEKLQLIQRMLKDEGYTIEGAKKRLKQGINKVDLNQDTLNSSDLVEENSIENQTMVNINNNYDLVKRLRLIRDGLESLKVKVHVKF
ncbi:MAG: MerR family transcriptional regulator [Chitinophagales bacterium]|nr:MerR family transcriptional regulator [Chitinophagales bacterium]